MHKSILILEENRIVHELFESILPEGKWVWEFHHESTPDNYLQKVHAVQPDIIFLSNQDQKRGYQTIKSLSNDQKLNSIPVILLTTARDQINEAFLESKGVVSFLQKPFEAATFFEQLDAVSGTTKHRSKNNPELDKINVIDDELRALLSDKENHSTGISLSSLENEIEPSSVLQPVKPELIDPDEFEEFDLPDENDYEEEQPFINKKEKQLADKKEKQPAKTQIPIITDASLKHPAPLLNVPDTERVTGVTELDIHFGTDSDSLGKTETDMMEELEGVDFESGDLEIDEIMDFENATQGYVLDDSEALKAFESDMDTPQDLDELKDLDQEEDNLLDVISNDEEGILELDIDEYEDDGTLNDNDLLIKETDELTGSDKDGTEDDILIPEEVENLEINLEEPKIVLPEIEEELPENAQFDLEDTIETQYDSTDEVQQTTTPSQHASETESREDDEKLAFLALENSINALDEGDDTKIEVNPNIFEMDDFNMGSVLDGNENGSSESKKDIDELPPDDSSILELAEEKVNKQESEKLLSDTLDEEIDFGESVSLDDGEIDLSLNIDEGSLEMEDDINFFDESIENEPEPSNDFIGNMTIPDPPDRETDNLRDIVADNTSGGKNLEQVTIRDDLGIRDLKQDIHEIEDYDEIKLSTDTEIDGDDEHLSVNGEDLLMDNKMDILEEENGDNSHNEDDLFAETELFENSDENEVMFEDSDENEVTFEDEVEDPFIESDPDNELSSDDLEPITEEPESKTSTHVTSEAEEAVSHDEVVRQSVFGHISQSSVPTSAGKEKPEMEEIVKLSESEQVPQADLSGMEEKISRAIHKNLDRAMPELIKIVREELENS